MIERRTTTQTISTSTGRLSGLASPVYDGKPETQYELFEGCVERFAVGAFDACLRENPDVVALWNHDANHVLGRTPNTLTLRSDSKGLHYEVALSPDIQLHRELQVSIARGDIKGSSFAFVPTKVSWSQEQGYDVRTIEGARLFDVSPVTTPAYSGSSVGLRSGDERRAIEQERDEHKLKVITEKWKARIDTLAGKRSE